MIEWLDSKAVVRDISRGGDDGTVRAAVMEADKTGFDCPLGWPDGFVTFVGDHRDGVVTVPWDFGDRGWRRPLTTRVTDLAVREV